MKTLYQTTVTVHGGRNGQVRSDDGLLDLGLAMPAELGGKGGATNPEQLFAAGYAACFESAARLVAQKQGVKLSDDAMEVRASVGLVPTAEGGFALTVAIEVAITGVEQASAEAIVEAAHAVCPYSNATRGNIDVKLSVTVR